MLTVCRECCLFSASTSFIQKMAVSSVVTSQVSRSRLTNYRNQRGLIDVLVVFLMLAVFRTNFVQAEESVDLNCASVVKYSYVTKGGFSKIPVPNSPLSGDHLRVCSAGLTCCTEEMEHLMAVQSKEEFDKAVKGSLTTLSQVLKTRATKFDDFFKELLTKSKREFHEMFKRTYGIIYEEHSYVFTDLFEELEKYYAKGRVDLLEAMENFFNVLYQKMFTVLNQQYRFDDRYLLCVSDHMKELKPFGDVPQKLSLQLKRSFVATRTFAQALAVAGEVAGNMVNLNFSGECTKAVMKMTQCPTCRGLPELKACSNYCINVMKGCLAYHSELDAEWNTFVDVMDKLVERLLGPFNIEMVVQPINIKISEAIMNFQESSAQVSQRVFSSCGKPMLGRRRRSADQEPENYPRFGRGLEHEDSRETRNYGGLKSGSRFRRENDGELRFGRENQGLKPDLESDSRFRREYDDSRSGEESYSRFRRVNQGLKHDLDSDLRFRRENEGLERDLDTNLRFRRDNQDLNSDLRFKRVTETSVPVLISKLGVQDTNLRFRREVVDLDWRISRLRRDPGSKNSGATSSGGELSTERLQFPRAGKHGNVGGSGGDEESDDLYGIGLDKLMKDIRLRVRDTKQFWARLPYQMCNGESVASGPGKEDSCWNGAQKARYENRVTGDGLTPQQKNPEVVVDVSRPSSLLNEQIYALKTINNKLKNAHMGVDVDWIDIEESFGAGGSGSGSGMGPTDDSDRDVTDDTEPDTVETGSGDGSSSRETGSNSRETGSNNRGSETGSSPPPTSSNNDEDNRLHPSLGGGVLGGGGGGGYNVTLNGNAIAGGASYRGVTLNRALVTYLVPVVVVWFGNGVTEWMQ